MGDPDLDRLSEQFDQAALTVAASLAVPMSLIDGRPWVPTAAEADAGDEPDLPSLW